MFYRTAEPMTAQGPRKGESSTLPLRNGLRTQPACLVRGSSRRIMSLRFRPAHIRLINRRASSWAVIGPAVQTCLQPNHGNTAGPSPATAASSYAPLRRLRSGSGGGKFGDICGTLTSRSISGMVSKFTLGSLRPVKSMAELNAVSLSWFVACFRSITFPRFFALQFH